jgi:hypothetical protein
MLYSPRGNIAFAHYPKTAGTSLGVWFRERFPDAVYVDAGNPHLAVHASLVRLGLVQGLPQGPRLVRESLRIFERGRTLLGLPTTQCDLRIIGVVRDPFEMIVSLYKYWRRCTTVANVTDRFVRTAIEGSFTEFFAAAVLRRHLRTYKGFFDFGGPAWSSTRLIDFRHLRAGLDDVSREFDIPSFGKPPAVLNADPAGGGDIERYRREVAHLLPALASRFSWYYSSFGNEAGHQVGRGSLLRAA